MLAYKSSDNSVTRNVSVANWDWVELNSEKEEEEEEKKAEENSAQLTLKALCGINIKYNQIKIFELIYVRNNALMQTYT